MGRQGREHLFALLMVVAVLVVSFVLVAVKLAPVSHSLRHGMFA